jgi:hypothetical protein
MAGLVAFQTLAEAIRAGYQVADRTENGYVVRIKDRSRVGSGCRRSAKVSFRRTAGAAHASMRPDR